MRKWCVLKQRQNMYITWACETDINDINKKINVFKRYNQQIPLLRTLNIGICVILFTEVGKHYWCN